MTWRRRLLSHTGIVFSIGRGMPLVHLFDSYEEAYGLAVVSEDMAVERLIYKYQGRELMWSPDGSESWPSLRQQ